MPRSRASKRYGHDEVWPTALVAMHAALAQMGPALRRRRCPIRGLSEVRTGARREPDALQGWRISVTHVRGGATVIAVGNRAADTSGEESLAPVRLRAEPSYESFFRSEYRGLVALAYALTGSRVVGEDLAQDSLLVAYRRWDYVAGLDRPEAWVRRTCTNMASSWRRRKGAEIRALVRSGSARVDAPTTGANDSEEFWASIRRLPRRQAQCVALRYVYECSVAEIAAMLSCSEGSVKQHLARAKSRLQTHLGR
jgi:RNA polymerase sigma factor (sigma-70 family)